MSVSEIIDQALQHPTVTARRSGVSRMTLNRIKHGTVSPTFDTLREILLTQGFDLQLSAVHASDPDASIAVRVMLDPAAEFPTPRSSVTEWMTRISRQEIDHPRDQVRYAASMAAPQHRVGAVFFAPRVQFSQDRVALALASAAQSQSYALSGAPAAKVMTGEEHGAPSILWLQEGQDLAWVADRLAQTFTRVEKYQPAGIILAETPSETLFDPYVDQGIIYTSPLQTVIDLYGVHAERAAEAISKDW